MTNTEFDRQIDNYVAAGFGEDLRERLEPLRQAFDAAETGDVPPVIVLKREMIGAERMVADIDRTDGVPETFINPAALEQYAVREGVPLPEGEAYVISGMSKEPETRNVAPGEALESIMAAGRSPLTIEEGLAVWRQFPDVIAVNDGLSLAASTRGDKRVPAIWIAKKQPKLGWCFLGVPHTWLATASLSTRIGQK
jgi:hypothetical protein